MNAITRLSDKGHVVVDAGDGVLLRPRCRIKTSTPSEVVARLKEIYLHQDPPVTLDETDEAIAEEAARRAERR